MKNETKMTKKQYYKKVDTLLNGLFISKNDYHWLIGDLQDLIFDIKFYNLIKDSSYVKKCLKILLKQLKENQQHLENIYNNLEKDKNIYFAKEELARLIKFNKRFEKSKEE